MFGFVEATILSLISLPFWRAICIRPVFHPLLLLLQRRDEKRNLPPFEDYEQLPWSAELKKQIPNIQNELNVFINKHAARVDADDFLFNDDDDENPAENSKESPDANPDPNPKILKYSNPSKRPACRMLRSGLGVFPLCDDSLVNFNAAARRHFSKTCSAIAKANGFHTKLWVLQKDTGKGVTCVTDVLNTTSGTSDGVWRVHVVLDADEANGGGGLVNLNAKVAARRDLDGSDDDSNSALSTVAGLVVAGESRGIDIGDVVVVNDLYRKRWFHKGVGDTKLWVLQKDTGKGVTCVTDVLNTTSGTSDGVWRVHVVLDADEANGGGGLVNLNAKVAARRDLDGSDDDSNSALSTVAGLVVAGESRGIDIGDVVVVNDLYRKRWFHKGVGEKMDSKMDAAMDSISQKENEKKNRTGAAIVLTFDVLRPEHKHCRVGFVKHKAKIVREVGETHQKDVTWWELASSVFGNLG